MLSCIPSKSHPEARYGFLILQAEFYSAGPGLSVAVLILIPTTIFPAYSELCATEFADLRKKLEEINLSIESYSFDIPKDLERGRAAIQHQLDDIVYPILTVPPEIISEIFRRCVSKPDDASDTASTSRAPLLFLRICRPWRVIALSTPMLGTEFNVTFLLLRPRQLKSLEKHVAEWTARASAAPVSLGFHDFAGRLAPERMSMLLHQYASRLGTLRLRTMLTTLSGLPDIGSLPLLQKLTLGYSPVAHDTSSVRIFRNAPQLREVTLEQSTVPSIFILPWHQLTTFTADRISVRASAYARATSYSLTYLPLKKATAAARRGTNRVRPLHRGGYPASADSGVHRCADALRPRKASPPHKHVAGLQ
ncbi:hypothetical protein DFH09DRAFT_1376233 [Mycena vulgaris]|nr:hypothetical protein DFH09DRAFT_1376233 [Mycena vulgaris]